jgi:hypothetical protein
MGHALLSAARAWHLLDSALAPDRERSYAVARERFVTAVEANRPVYPDSTMVEPSVACVSRAKASVDGRGQPTSSV